MFSSPQAKEPLIPIQPAKRPWQRIGADLFQHEDQNFLIIVDYFSNYPEVVKLSSTSSSNIIKQMKYIFSMHGIPEEIVTD